MAGARREASPPPAVALDLDGVVWRGSTLVAGAADAVAALRSAGTRVAFVTNNSSAPPDAVAERLRGHGIDAAPSDVLTSAQAAAGLLAGEERIATGDRVLACAGAGVRVALQAAGFEVVEAPPAVAVVVGWHRDFDFDRLARAATAVRDGARFVATNVEPTYPVEDGVLPGNGALVAAVRTASGVEPVVAGKPEPAMVALVRRTLGPDGLVVGDRPSTDGALATALGWPFALVRSGVAEEPGAELAGGGRPAHVADDLAALVRDLLPGPDRERGQSHGPRRP